jgi:hypothetical protein
MFARDLPKPYEIARSEFEPILSSNGFRFVSETYAPESFGSAYAEYRRDVTWLRLIWDGKDHWLAMSVARPVDRPPGIDDWQDLEYQLDGAPKRVMQLDAAYLPQRLGELRDALERLIASGNAPEV